MDQQKQKKILSLLDVLGSTIVDIFYNHMYDRAISMKEKTENNITTCYCTAITEYVKTSDSPEFYKTLINSIHYYTRVSTIYSDLSFIDCINLYASLFIPEVYIQSLTEKQKHDILSMVLRDTIKSFSNDLLSNYLSLIIDEHQDPTNISLLQDIILKELVKHRDVSYSRFIKCEQPGQKDATKPVSKKIIGLPKIVKTQKTLTKLNRLYKQSLDDKNKLKSKNTDLQNKYKSLVEQCKDLQTMLLSQIALYKDKELELNTIKKKTSPLNNRVTTKGSSRTFSPQGSPTRNKSVSFNEDHISSIELSVKQADGPDYENLFDVQYGDDE